jgi:hypothetical protein
MEIVAGNALPAAHAAKLSRDRARRFSAAQRLIERINDDIDPQFRIALQTFMPSPPSFPLRV